MSPIAGMGSRLAHAMIATNSANSVGDGLHKTPCAREAEWRFP